MGKELKKAKLSTSVVYRWDNGSNDSDTDIASQQFSRDERRILRNVDLHLIPPFALLYLLNFLDRTSVSNAVLVGMEEEIGLHGSQYNVGLALFFIGYSLFAAPSNYCLQKTSPRFWLSTIMGIWGVVMTSTGVIKDFAGFASVRILLGVTEAGMLPGISFTLTKWYKKEELQTRQALFYCSACIAGAFGGLLAWVISKMDNKGNLSGWRWIFILEGALTILVAVSSYLFLPSYPNNATFLKKHEREFITKRVNTIRAQRHVNRDYNKPGWYWVLLSVTDWQVWIHTVIYFSLHCVVYGLSLVLPSIMNNFGYSKSLSLLLTVPVYVSASCCSIVLASLSDKLRLRSPVLIICFLFM